MGQVAASMLCDLFVGLFAVSLVAGAHAKDITNSNFFDVIALYEDYDSELLGKFGPIEGESEYGNVGRQRGDLPLRHLLPFVFHQLTLMNAGWLLPSLSVFWHFLFLCCAHVGSRLCVRFAYTLDCYTATFTAAFHTRMGHVRCD